LDPSDCPQKEGRQSMPCRYRGPGSCSKKRVRGDPVPRMRIRIARPHPRPRVARHGTAGARGSLVSSASSADRDHPVPLEAAGTALAARGPRSGMNHSGRGGNGRVVVVRLYGIAGCVRTPPPTPASGTDRSRHRMRLGGPCTDGLVCAASISRKGGVARRRHGCGGLVYQSRCAVGWGR